LTFIADLRVPLIGAMSLFIVKIERGNRSCSRGNQILATRGRDQVLTSREGYDGHVSRRPEIEKACLFLA